MVKWFKALFAWKKVKECGVYLYEENSVTGARRAFRIYQSGYSPLDIDWINRQTNIIVPPTGGSGIHG